MKKCPRCGVPVPFQGCPTCPPKLMPCLKCGEMVLIEPMPDEALDAILRDRGKRVNERF